MDDIEFPPFLGYRSWQIIAPAIMTEKSDISRIFRDQRDVGANKFQGINSREERACSR